MATSLDDTQAVRRFAVHARHDGHRRGHIVEGRSFEDAAVAFVERWHPAFDADGDVSVLVTDQESGLELCYKVDIEGGDASPCG